MGSRNKVLNEKRMFLLSGAPTHSAHLTSVQRSTLLSHAFRIKRRSSSKAATTVHGSVSYLRIYRYGRCLYRCTGLPAPVYRSQTSEGPFSAVSKPTFATKGLLCINLQKRFTRLACLFTLLHACHLHFFTPMKFRRQIRVTPQILHTSNKNLFHVMSHIF